MLAPMTAQNCLHCQCVGKQLFLCEHCNKIREKLPQFTYFDVFSLAPTFPLSSQLLESKYEDLMLQLHPDFFSQEPAAIQQLSESYAAIALSAKETLKDPFQLALYWLDLLGKKPTNKELLPDSAFLGLVMEAQEDLAQKNTEAALHWQAVFEPEWQGLEQKISHIFQQLQQESASLNFAVLYSLLGKFRYLQNIQQIIQKQLSR